MKNAPRAALCLALAAAPLGCAAPEVQRTARSGERATGELKLALAVTGKTRESVKQLHALGRTAGAGRSTGGAGIVSFYANRAFASINEVLRANFGSVTIVDNDAQAKDAGADLVAVLDYDARAKDRNWTLHFLMGLGAGSLFGYWTNPLLVDLKADATFLTIEQKPIDLIHVEAHRRQGLGMIGDVMAEGADELGIRFENALADSAPLARYARESAKRKAAPAAAIAAAVAEPAALSSDVDAPDYDSPQAPNLFALVIGIEKYSSVPDAAFAERDAAAVRRHLLALGYPERNILFLGGEQATRSAIQKYLEDWLPRNVKEDSQVLFYFSGHGAPDPASKQAYLVPWDGDPKFLENTGYAMTRLYRSLGALKARQVLVALDTCFSGAGGRSVLAQGTRPLVMKLDAAVPPSGGRVSVLSASAADQITGSDNAQGHGLFTYHLLKALNWTKGQASVQEAYSALLPDVQDAARRQNREQTPQWIQSGPEPLYFR